MIQDKDVELTVVVPVYNEAGNIDLMVQTLSEALRGCTASFELLFVDDGSTDATEARLIEWQNKDAHVHSISFTRNFGKEAAMSAGLANSRGRAVVIIDGDGQHPSTILPQMLERWRAGAAVVEAVKTDRGQGSTLGHWGAALFYWLFKQLSGVTLENGSDFKLMDRTVVEAILAMPERERFFRGLISYAGYPAEQLSFAVVDRHAGETKWKKGALYRYALHNLTSFSAAPLRLATFLGIVMTILFIILGLQTLYNYFSGHALSGFSTVILLVLFIGAMHSFILGIIGQYLAHIYNEVKGRPPYIIRRFRR